MQSATFQGASPKRTLARFYNFLWGSIHSNHAFLQSLMYRILIGTTIEADVLLLLLLLLDLIQVTNL